jgi:hypothetical protein
LLYSKIKSRVGKTYRDILVHTYLFFSDCWLEVNICLDSPATGHLDTSPLAFPLFSRKFCYGSHFPTSLLSYCNTYPTAYLTNQPPCFPNYRLRVHYHIKTPLPFSVISTSLNIDFIPYETFSCVQLYPLSYKMHKSLRDFKPLRYSSRDGHIEGEHVNRGRDIQSFYPTLQVLNMSNLGDVTDVNPVIFEHARHSRPMTPADLFVSRRTGRHCAGISCTTHGLFLSVGGSVWHIVRNLHCTVTIDSVLANSKTQNAFLFPAHAMYAKVPNTHTHTHTNLERFSTC